MDGLDKLRQLDETRFVVLELFSCILIADTLTIETRTKGLTTLTVINCRQCFLPNSRGPVWVPVSSDVGALDGRRSCRAVIVRASESTSWEGGRREDPRVGFGLQFAVVGRTKTSGASQAVPVWNVHKTLTSLTTDCGDNNRWIGPRRSAPFKRCLSGISKQSFSTTTNIRSRP